MNNASPIKSSESVSAEFFACIKRNQSLNLTFFVILIGSIALVLFTKTYALLFIPFLAGVIYLAITFYKAQKLFFSGLAKSLGLNYGLTPPVDSLPCSHFKRGRGRVISNYMNGKYKSNDIEYFNYQYTTGSGKHKKTWRSSVACVTLKHTTPEIILNSKSGMLMISSVLLGENQMKRIPTEGWFEKHFETHSVDKHEIEVLEVLTTDIMEKLIERGETLDFQFIQNRVYIFENGYLSRREDIIKLFELSIFLADSLNPKLERLQDDLIALRR